jgi:hypothetical protein
MPLAKTEFLTICKKMRHKPQPAAEIICSALTDCKKFVPCVKVAEKRGRAIRMRNGWKKALGDIKQGNYVTAFMFCEVLETHLNPTRKAVCKLIPAQASAHLLKVITQQRNAGRVSYKAVKCYYLKRYAKKAGPKWHKKATVLCREIDLARALNRARVKVDKQLQMDSPYLPGQCYEKRLAKHRKIGTKWAVTAVKRLVDLCYYKLGRHILKKKVPKLISGCRIKAVYLGIRKYKIRGPVIDRLMRQAARKCP